MGGDNREENLVWLTAEEHYVAHQLLAKIYPDNLGLIYACFKMSHNNGKHQRSNKLYGWLRARASKLQSLASAGENNAFYGKKHTEETKAKIRAARALQKSVEGQYERMAENHRGSKRTQETKDNISAALKGRTSNILPEVRAAGVLKASAKTTGTKHPLLSCMVCKKELGARGLTNHFRGFHERE
jgi:hypothetical protein